jgi:hypothetical protein
MGSSGGGGGGAGIVDYPGYMKLTHSDWLNKGDGTNIVDTIEKSITEVMDSALGSSPWSGLSTYPVADDIDDYMTVLNAFVALLAGINELSDWDSIHTQAMTSIGTFTPLTVADITALMVPDATVSNMTVADMVAVADLAAIADVNVVDADGVTDAAIILDVDAFADQLDDEITNKILPRFRRGMQDIGAVSSSSFAIGEACIEGFRNRDVSRHNSQLRVSAAIKNADVNVANMDKDIRVGLGNISKDLDISKANQAKNLEISRSNQLKNISVGTVNTNKDVQVTVPNMNKALDIAKSNQGMDFRVGELNLRTDAQYATMYIEAAQQMLQFTMQNYEWGLNMVKTTIEANRIKIVAMKEMTESNNSIGEQDALWDLTVFQHGANVLASIGGGTAVPTQKKTNQVASALGGALSGAVAGGMVGGAMAGGTAGSVVPVYGTIIGAVLGAAIGLLSS